MVSQPSLRFSIFLSPHFARPGTGGHDEEGKVPLSRASQVTGHHHQGQSSQTSSRRNHARHWKKGCFCISEALQEQELIFPQCRRLKRHGFDPWVGKIPSSGHGNPLLYSCLENFKQEAPGSCSPWGHKDSDMTEPLTLSLFMQE